MEKSTHQLKPKLRERYNRKRSEISFHFEYLGDLKQYNSNNIKNNKNAALAQNELDEMLLTPQNRNIETNLRIRPTHDSFKLRNEVRFNDNNDDKTVYLKTMSQNATPRASKEKNKSIEQLNKLTRHSINSLDSRSFTKMNADLYFYPSNTLEESRNSSRSNRQSRVEKSVASKHVEISKPTGSKINTK